METIQTIITIVACLSAFGTAWKMITTLVHTQDDMKAIKRHMDETYMMCLRLTIMSHDMPLSERLIAGERYIQHNGNGDVKKYIHEVLQGDKKIDA